MQINRVNLTNCQDVTGPVIVIDVLRAFTTAAYIFAAGAADITLVSSVEEAFDLKRKNPDFILAGELNTFPIEGFDYGNSSSPFAGLDLKGSHIVQRTTCGTQGVIQAKKASHILLCSLCCVSATARYISAQGWSSITLNQTGIRPGGRGDEDVVCADLLESILTKTPMDHKRVEKRVRESINGLMYGSRPDLPPMDLDLAAAIDRFDFAMVVEKIGRQFIATPYYG
jgi:2-phosphosulfolactate phosphatase